MMDAPARVAADERDAAREARVARWLFLAAWIAFASFHQGGGWHQNARFAAVRAIVEQGRFSVDDYAIYRVLWAPAASRASNG